MSWTQALTFNHHKNWALVDFLGALLDIQLEQLPGSSDCVSVHFEWIQKARILEAKSEKFIQPLFRLDLTVQEVMDKMGLPFENLFKLLPDNLVPTMAEESTFPGNQNRTSPVDLPSSYDGYNLHFHMVSLKIVTYYFAKYMDATFTSDSEYKQYMQFDNASISSYKLTYEWFDTYPHPDCPQIVHKPKLFSWNEAFGFCAQYNGCTLPEFTDEADQEKFISAVLVSKSLFPVEAVYIGIRQKSQVRVVHFGLK